MPPETRRQVRQRSLLEHATVRTEVDNAKGKRSEQDMIQNEDQHVDMKAKRNFRSTKDKTLLRRKGKGKEKGKEKGKKKEKEKENEIAQENSESSQRQSESESHSPPHVPAITIDSSLEDESEIPATKRTGAALRRSKIAESGIDIEVLPLTKSRNLEGNRKSRSNRATQRSLLEYATPRKSGAQKKFAHVASKVESGSGSDSPRKFRFEPRIKREPTPSLNANSDPEGDDDSEPMQILNRARRERVIQKPSGEATVATSDDSLSMRNQHSDPDEDLPSPRKRRRLIRENRPRLADLSSEDEQLLEEAEEEESILSSRLRNRSKKTDFMRNLERLKKKRQGENTEGDEEEDEEEDDSQENQSSSSEAESARSKDDVLAGAKPSHLYVSDGDTPDQDDDFIVEDDEGAIELPPMFNMGTFQDLSHHFKVACQLFVHLSMKRRGQRTPFMKQALENNYFAVPLNMSRRKLLGLRDSLVASSIWRPEFRKALEKYPDFKLQRLDFAVPHCDACSLGSRLSTFQGLLRGQRYDHTTYQSKGKDFSLDWNLGRYCAARAQIFHKLSHWEYTLFHTLDTEINSLRTKIQDHAGSRGSIFMPATKGPPPPDDLDDADGWMEWLDGRGIIEAEWREINALMDKAHGLEARGKNDNDDVEYS